ncbi:hypothetical protein BFN03_11890 [Rhodococcus sp. WMMA185]|uniref:hypothetical protein n=1 Tax=Rhodococcus sp. WMMA185 TaxID=679318 RepID=UPI0008791C3A|nr:hypothetical protein [Rhodococcus sp. WMMA185]AOW94867.1 hypothetical protein BFN03_11890 [Rhodococcus sp. WMMA185]
MGTGRRLAAIAASITVLGSGATGVAWGGTLDSAVPVSAQGYLVQEPYDSQDVDPEECNDLWGDYVPGFGVNPFSQLQDCDNPNTEVPPPVNGGDSPQSEDDRGVVNPY